MLLARVTIDIIIDEEKAGRLSEEELDKLSEQASDIAEKLEDLCKLGDWQADPRVKILASQTG